MSPRERADAARIRQFLEALGHAFRRPARLYLSGGESLVWRGLRGSTRDIDVTYEVDPAHHDEWIRALRDLKERLSVNVEEAGPGDFIPLPPGHESRATHVGRFGSVDVYLLDPYSIALSKIERGHAQDLEDVRKLLGAGVIDAAELRRLFEEVLPRYESGSVRANPDRYRRLLEAVLAD